MSNLALIVVEPERGRLGDARGLSDRLAYAAVLTHTLRRAAAIERVQRIVVLHVPGQNPLEHINRGAVTKPIETFAHEAVAGDDFSARMRVARSWARSAWRGGLGGATAWDELLPATPMAAAMAKFNGKAAVLVGGDWCAFDPGLADRLLAMHLEAPDSMKLTFTQAPPGLSPIVTSRSVLEGMTEKQATFGGVLAYSPKHPMIDPIGRDVNLPIAASIRDTARRFIYDTPDARQRLSLIAEHMGDDFGDADALTITNACRAVEAERFDDCFETLPDEFIVEVTPRRLATGPIVPQTRLDLPRGDMDLSLARALFPQLRGKAVTLGGLGDATLHEDFETLVTIAREAGVRSLHVQTDLLAGRDRLAALVDLPIDVVSVRLNADTQATYETLMGTDRFKDVVDTLQWLFERRSERGGALGVPWIVPRLTKVTGNLKDLETFFERWMQIIGHAVIDRPPTGGTGGHALVDDLSPVPMTPPWREPSPLQVKRRLTVLSDGSVVLCQQDWLARAALGRIGDTTLADIWRSAGELQVPGALDDSPVCRKCFDWWSMHRFAAAGVA